MKLYWYILEIVMGTCIFVSVCMPWIHVCIFLVSNCFTDNWPGMCKEMYALYIYSKRVTFLYYTCLVWFLHCFLFLYAVGNYMHWFESAFLFFYTTGIQYMYIYRYIYILIYAFSKAYTSLCIRFWYFYYFSVSRSLI